MPDAIWGIVLVVFVVAGGLYFDVLIVKGLAATIRHKPNGYTPVQVIIAIVVLLTSTLLGASMGAQVVVTTWQSIFP